MFAQRLPSKLRYCSLTQQCSETHKHVTHKFTARVSLLQLKSSLNLIFASLYVSDMYLGGNAVRITHCQRLLNLSMFSIIINTPC